MAIDTATFEATLDSKIDAATTSNDAKEFLLLAKAVEATNNAISTTSLQVSNNLSDLANSTTALTNLGAAGLASPAFTGTPTAPTATAGTNTTQIATTAFVAGEVAGIVDAAPATLNTLNELAAALGDDANFSTTVTNSIATKLPLAGGTLTGDLTLTSSSGNRQIAITSTSGIASLEVGGSTSAFIDVKIPNTDDFDTRYGHESLNCTGDYVFQRANATKLAINATGADVTGTLTADGVTVDGPLDIEEVKEKVTPSTTTTGTLNFNLADQAIVNLTSDQTANRTINLRGNGSTTLNSIMATDQSMTCTVLAKQGSTAYYFNAYQVDGTAVTPKWSGGSAPTAGNASGIDVYTFTIIKTADATFTVLASQTQYA